MSQSWIEEVDISSIEDDQAYFLAKKWESSMGVANYLFLSKLLNGKQKFSSKPGIAIRAICNDNFRKILAEHPNYVALKIPMDADKRWKARTKNRRNTP